MTYVDDFNQLLPELKALDKDVIWNPRAPIDVAAQEGYNLYKWATEDKDVLAGNGLDLNLVESIPARVGALCHAEAEWLLVKGKYHKMKEIWEEESPQGYELRHLIIRNFRYAFKNNKTALDQLKKITEGHRQSDMVMDLYKLANMGNSYPDELSAIHFDMDLLEDARNMTQRMQDVLADYQNSAQNIPALDIRNRAYTFLQMAVTEIRSCGQFSFYGEDSRLKGYLVKYKRRSKRSDSGENPNVSPNDDVEPLMPNSDVGT